LPGAFLERVAAQMADIGDACNSLFWSNSESASLEIRARLLRHDSSLAARIQFMTTTALSHDPLHTRISLEE
jgi:hypothetical protein